MKKIIFLTITLFPLWGLGGIYAQKELWGVNSGDRNNYPNPSYFGNITKYDINGENPAIMHEFDFVKGAAPVGRLFLASNGKLYGTTLYGGNVGPTGSFVSVGVLFEYDLILNKYRVVKYFEIDNIIGAINPEIGVIEPIQGKLYGGVNNRIYKYDIATETITVSNAIGNSKFSGELLKASDNNLYSVVYISFCPSFNEPLPLNGSVVKYNMTTNILSIIYPLSCNFYAEGFFPQKQLVETTPGKLIGTTRDGGIYLNTAVTPFINGGTLFEYTINTNTLIRKYDFASNTTGTFPNGVIDGGNGKLYGLLEQGGIPPGNTSTNLSDFRGTLYEYTPATNAVEVKQYFGPIPGPSGYVRYPTSLMKTSLGTYAGTIPNGALFKWNANTNLITNPDYSNVICPCPNLNNNSNLIEICRKPSYREFIPDTFAPATGSAFTYDIQNTNATTYVWKKAATVLPLQTTAILNLPSITTADTGIYTCTMTNECGTTVTMNLYINVDNLGIDLMPIYKNNIKLYPNPTLATLNIELPQSVAILKCFISNSIGQIVFKSLDNKNKIDVSNLQQGVYIVSLETNYGKWNGKFVKE